MSESIVLDIRNLKSHFFTAKGEVPAVDGVTIQVPPGKIIGIVGESGCGKSMTAMSVMGLLRYPGRVVEGSITLDGRDITHLSPRELAKVRGNEISMIFQEPMTSLNPVYPVGRRFGRQFFSIRRYQRKRPESGCWRFFRQWEFRSRRSGTTAIPTSFPADCARE